ncbi:hypothetical protein [Sorangium sp. So ce887]|uniref:hypothetical protein n=1 Tax=Sorangium sp. So ce887 TaxID=3133324 RepID=UPI003F643958
MIVIVEEAVFASGRTSSLELLALFHACLDDRHALLTDPPFAKGISPTIDDWLASLPEALKDEAAFVLDEGASAASQRTSAAVRIRVGDVASSDLRSATPTVMLADALRLLHAPLRLLVENRRNDGAFLRKLAPPTWRRKFVEALERRWIELDNGGGLGELTATVNAAAREPREHMRLWVMFDSDARQPGQPSADARAALVACQAIKQPWPVPAHCLERRAIENYLPVQALFVWAELASGPEKTRLRRCAEAFKQLNPSQRAHYNMKRGLWGELTSERQRSYIKQDSDVIDEAELPPLFRGLPEDPRRHLLHGFGKDVGSLFHDEDSGIRVVEDWLRKEIPDQVRATLIQAIFDRM